MDPNDLPDTTGGPMTEEKRVPIPERYKDRHTLLKAWTDAGKHPETEYTTFMFAQEIVKYFEELGAAETKVAKLKKLNARLLYDLKELLYHTEMKGDCNKLLAVVKARNSIAAAEAQTTL